MLCVIGWLQLIIYAYNFSYYLGFMNRIGRFDVKQYLASGITTAFQRTSVIRYDFAVYSVLSNSCNSLTYIYGVIPLLAGNVAVAIYSVV